MSNNKIIQFSYFYWHTNEKKADVTRKRPYFTMESAMTAILRDVSGKMQHGILFDRRLQVNSVARKHSQRCNWEARGERSQLIQLYEIC